MKKSYFLALFFCLTGLLNATNKLSFCGCVFVCIAALGNSMVHLYGRKKTMQCLLLSLVVHTMLAWHTAYTLRGVRFDCMIPLSFLAVFVSLYAGMRAFVRLQSTYGWSIRNGIGLLVASILDSSIVMLYLAGKFSASRVCSIFLKDVAYKCGYSIAVSGIVVVTAYLYRRLYRGTSLQKSNQDSSYTTPWFRACGDSGTEIKRKKQILSLCTVCLLLAHQTHAIGLSTGPVLAVSGYRAQFDTQDACHSCHSTYCLTTFGGQGGWFAKLDGGLLYAKADVLFAVERFKLSDVRSATYFTSCCVPISIGSTFFGVFCPHLGCLFKFPLGENAIPNKQAFSDLNNKEIFHAFLVGLGIDSAGIIVDLDFEIMRTSISRHALYALLKDSQKTYKPKKWTLRIGWNVLR